MKKTFSTTLLFVLLFLLAGCAKQPHQPPAVRRQLGAGEAQPTSGSPAATEPAATRLAGRKRPLPAGASVHQPARRRRV